MADAYLLNPRRRRRRTTRRRRKTTRRRRRRNPARTSYSRPPRRRRRTRRRNPTHRRRSYRRNPRIGVSSFIPPMRAIVDSAVIFGGKVAAQGAGTWAYRKFLTGENESPFEQNDQGNSVATSLPKLLLGVYGAGALGSIALRILKMRRFQDEWWKGTMFSIYHLLTWNTWTSNQATAENDFQVFLRDGLFGAGGTRDYVTARGGMARRGVARRGVAQRGMAQRGGLRDYVTTSGYNLQVPQGAAHPGPTQRPLF